MLPKSRMLVVYQTLEGKIPIACPYRYVGHSSQLDPKTIVGSPIISGIGSILINKSISFF